MNTNEEVLDFCTVFFFYDHYNFERVIKLNRARDCIFKVFSRCDFFSEVISIRALGVIDDIWLMVIDGNNENLVQVNTNLRIRISQLLCLGNVHRQKTI